MQRPSDREFLAEVLRELPDLPEGLAEKFLELAGESSESRAAAIRKLFEAEYQRQYGLKLDGMAVEVVNWLVTASGPQPDRGGSAARSTGKTVKPGKRTVHLAGKSRAVPVYRRSQITASDRIAGPVIIEERETTIFILENWTVSLHETGSLVAEKQGA